MRNWIAIVSGINWVCVLAQDTATACSSAKTNSVCDKLVEGDNKLCFWNPVTISCQSVGGLECRRDVPNADGHSYSDCKPSTMECVNPTDQNKLVEYGQMGICRMRCSGKHFAESCEQCSPHGEECGGSCAWSYNKCVPRTNEFKLCTIEENASSDCAAGEKCMEDGGKGLCPQSVVGMSPKICHCAPDHKQTLQQQTLPDELNSIIGDSETKKPWALPSPTQEEIDAKEKNEFRDGVLDSVFQKEESSITREPLTMSVLLQHGLYSNKQKHTDIQSGPKASLFLTDKKEVKHQDNDGTSTEVVPKESGSEDGQTTKRPSGRDGSRRSILVALLTLII